MADIEGQPGWPTSLSEAVEAHQEGESVDQVRRAVAPVLADRSPEDVLGRLLDLGMEQGPAEGVVEYAVTRRALDAALRAAGVPGSVLYRHVAGEWQVYNGGFHRAVVTASQMVKDFQSVHEMLLVALRPVGYEVEFAPGDWAVLRPLG